MNHDGRGHHYLLIEHGKTDDTASSKFGRLTATVAALAPAPSHSERRHAHLARSLRWGGLTLATLLLGATALPADRFAAHAQASALTEAPTVIDALNNINSRLALFGQMDFMNRNMASMTHSMGSTMGRMGNWLP